MSEEEKAIEVLKQLPVTLAISHLGGGAEIQTVLNLIEEQQAEIEEYKKTIAQDNKEYEHMKKSLKGIISKLNAELNTELEKKDKIIDLMAEQLAGLTIFDVEKNEALILGDKEDVIKYFEKKANSIEEN